MSRERSEIPREVQITIYDMIDAPPMENPCEEFEEIGFKYEYIKGMVDKTPHYTRCEEDRIVYTSEDGRIKIQFNLAGHSIVLQKKNGNCEFYGGYETFFINSDIYRCMNKVMTTLGWL